MFSKIAESANLFHATLRAAFSFWPQAAVSDREQLSLGL
jgi:hypothetical protein